MFGERPSLRSRSSRAVLSSGSVVASTMRLARPENVTARRRYCQMHALIFDLDGTLVDTVYAHVFAWQRALLEAGHAGRRLADPPADRDERRLVRPGRRPRDRSRADRRRGRDAPAAPRRDLPRVPARAAAAARARSSSSTTSARAASSTASRPRAGARRSTRRSRRSASRRTRSSSSGRRPAGQARAGPVPRLPGAAGRRDRATATSSATRSGTSSPRGGPGCSASGC